MAELDPAAARPLTSREISKVLIAILGGVAATVPGAMDRVPTILDYAAKERPGTLHMSWEIAFTATVAGFRGWCKPSDIATAVAWVAENLHRLFAPDVRVSN